MMTLPKLQLIFLLLSSLFFSSCSAAESSIHAAGRAPPLCDRQAEKENAIVLWGTAWRSNQKEMQFREQKAAGAVERFFKEQSCYAKTGIVRNLSGRDPMLLSDIEAFNLVSALPEKYDKIIILRVEELGPLLVFYCSPILWEGGSEAVVRIRILDVKSASMASDVVIHRRDSGPFVLRGTERLEEDLTAALAELFVNR